MAAAHGLSNAKILLEEVQKGKSPYHFIEVMACPGGCLGGGGQPMPTNTKVRKARAASLYREDRGKPIRKSHKTTIYPDYDTIYSDIYIALYIMPLVLAQYIIILYLCSMGGRNQK